MNDEAARLDCPSVFAFASDAALARQSAPFTSAGARNNGVICSDSPESLGSIERLVRLVHQRLAGGPILGKLDDAKAQRQRLTIPDDHARGGCAHAFGHFKSSLSICVG